MRGKRSAAIRPVYVLVIALAAVLHAYLYLYRFLGTWLIDAPSYWVGAMAVFELDSSPYGTGFDDALAELTDLFAHPFIYPPPSLFFFWPLSFFEELQDAATAMLAINWVSALAISVLLAIHMRRVYATPDALIALLFVILLFAQPVRINLGHGQTNMLAVALVLGAMMRSPMGAQTGALFALAGTAKIYAGVALLPALLSGSRSIFVGFLLTAAVLFAVSVAAFGIDVWQDWITQVVLAENYAARFSVENEANISLQGFAARLFGLPLLGVLLGLLVLTFFVAFSKRFRRDGFLAVTVALCFAVLLPEIAWLHYAVFLLPASALLLAESYARREWGLLSLSGLNLALLALNPFFAVLGESATLAWTGSAVYVLIAGSYLAWSKSADAAY